MPRAPNYDFERQERDRKKAMKKAEKLGAKREAKAKSDEEQVEQGRTPVKSAAE